ncbi:trypsin-like serine protease [Nocardia sp. NPDC004722]
MRYPKKASRLLAAAVAAVGLMAVLPASADADRTWVTAPGATIYSDTRTCSLGALGTIGGVVSGVQYGVTAAHCFEDGKPVFMGGLNSAQLLGHYEQSYGTDATDEDLGFSLIRLEPNIVMRAFLPDRTTIMNTAEADPYVGEEVCHYGYGTGLTCGTITAVRDHYFQADFPSKPGDSGGVVYHKTGDNRADFLGILIGRNDGGPVIESAKYMRELISSHAGGQFDWYTE